MSPAEAVCETCRNAIADSDFETGAAISVLGKNYCGVCKNRAVQDVSLDDLVADASPQPGTVPKTVKTVPPAARKGPAAGLDAAEMPTIKAPASRPAPPPRARSGEPPPHTRRATPAPAPPRSSAKPVIIAVSIGIVAAVLTVLGLKSGEDPDRGGKARPTDPGEKTPGVVLDPAAQKLAAAEKAFQSTSLLASRAGVKPDEVIAAIDKARPACKGSPFEKRLEDLWHQKLQEKEAAEAALALSRQMEELKAAVAADAKFARYAELMEKFQRARELSAKAGGGRRRDLEDIEVEYKSRYEQEADPFLKEIKEAASQLSGEGRYDDALAQIERFPAHLRYSGAWKELERLRADVQRRKAGNKKQ